MDENIPDIKSVRQERIARVTKAVEEVCNEHLHNFYENLTVAWIKKDSLHEFEFIVTGFDFNPAEDSTKALNEIFRLLNDKAQTQLHEFTIIRTTKGISLTRPRAA